VFELLQQVQFVICLVVSLMVELVELIFVELIELVLLSLGLKQSSSLVLLLEQSDFLVN
jgi:hypothetical protein